MKKNRFRLLGIMLLSVFLLEACNLPTGKSSEETPASLPTKIAVVIPSATTAAAATLPTKDGNTPVPPTAPLPAATKTPIPCNRASFVKDVTYPDGTKVTAGSSFTKTWRIKNNGSCTWTSGYVLLFDSGDQMNAPATGPVTSGTVAPGETVDISVNLTAPGAPGSYQGNFKLRSADNIVFGINANAQGPFWVKIVVLPTATATIPLPPPPPPIYSSGNLTINALDTADLDKGQINPTSAQADIWYKSLLGNQSIFSENSTVFLDFGTNTPSKTQCDISMGFTEIPLSGGSVNRYICYKTAQGRIGYFQIIAFSNNSLKISYNTWE
jgi:hypothetical protein